MLESLPDLSLAMTTAAEGDSAPRTSLVLAPLLESLPELSLGMATTAAAAGDPPLSVLLRLLDLPDLLQAEAGAYTRPGFGST